MKNRGSRSSTTTSGGNSTIFGAFFSSATTTKKNDGLPSAVRRRQQRHHNSNNKGRGGGGSWWPLKMLLSSIRQYKVRWLLVLLVFVTTGTEYSVWKNGKGKQRGAIVSMVSTWMAANEPPPPITPGTPKKGRTPLTASMLVGMAPEVQKQMLGERLAFLIRPSQPALTGKITVLLLELDNNHLLQLLDTPAALQVKIQAAVQYLVDNDHQIPPNYSSQEVLNINIGSRVKFYDEASNNPP